LANVAMQRERMLDDDRATLVKSAARLHAMALSQHKHIGPNDVDVMLPVIAVPSNKYLDIDTATNCIDIDTPSKCIQLVDIDDGGGIYGATKMDRCTQQLSTVSSAVVPTVDLSAGTPPGKDSVMKRQISPEDPEDEDDGQFTPVINEKLKHEQSLVLQQMGETHHSMGEDTWHQVQGEAVQTVTSCCPCLASTIRTSATWFRDANQRRHDSSSFIGKTVESKTFNILVGLLILANGFVMAMRLELGGKAGEIALGRREDDGSWEDGEAVFNIVEHVFNILFVLELLLRATIMRLTLCTDPTSLFDVIIVAVSSIQLYILEPLNLKAGGNVTLFRMLRFVRFVRVIGLVRVMKMFSDLRVLVQTCISSFKALVWSMVLLFLIMTMSGLFLCELLKEYIRDTDRSVEMRSWVYQYYGTSSRAIFTMFELTLSGCWPNYFRPLIENVSGFFVIFTVMYISGVVFAINTIIKALFLKETLVIASNDAEMMINEANKKKHRYVHKLEKFFKAIDTTGDGKLCYEEFEACMNHSEVKTWMQVLELEVQDARALFNLLDDGDGAVSHEDFLKGVMRLKGQARCVDVVAIMASSDKTLVAVNLLQQQVGAILKVLQI